MVSILKVLYEDNHLIVLNKPSGLLTEPSGTVQDSLYDQVKLYIKEKYQKPGNVYLGIVHRLDKPASGVVIFAKTSKALSRLNQNLREKKFKKIYCALVENRISLEEGKVESYLVHDDFRATISEKNHPKAKLSKLTYRTIKKNRKTRLLEIILETGRYHQIRVQMSSLGCPIVGDEKYGSLLKWILKEGIALHHSKLELEHPVTKEWLVFEAPLPNYFFTYSVQ